MIYNNISPLDHPDAFIVDTSKFDNTKPGTYKIKIKCADNIAGEYWAWNEVSFDVTVTDEKITTSVKESLTTQTTVVCPTEETTTTVALTTTQTSIDIHYDYAGKISVVNQPDKIEYCVGEKFDLTGLTITLKTDHPEYKNAFVNVSPLDYPELFAVDISEFDSAKAGTYRIDIAAINQLKYAHSILGVGSASVTVTVTEPEIYGDSDRNGILNTRDAAYIARKLARQEQSEFTLDADFNKDGVVNIRDAAAIARSLASKGK